MVELSGERTGEQRRLAIGLLVYLESTSTEIAKGLYLVAHRRLRSLPGWDGVGVIEEIRGDTERWDNLGS